MTINPSQDWAILIGGGGRWEGEGEGEGEGARFIILLPVSLLAIPSIGISVNIVVSQ